MSSSVWSQGGESYAEQYAGLVGSPGQDLHRYTEGPSAYLNGPPNLGSKTTLERGVHLSPRGRVTQGKYTGPAQLTAMQQDRKLACRRSVAGPDPYALAAANLWYPKPQQRWQATFTAETGIPAALTTRRAVAGGVYYGHGERTPHILGTTHTQVFDRYHVNSRNQWRHTSNSIKSILANPMPQTPHGSSLIPLSARARTAAEKRRRAYHPMGGAFGTLNSSRDVTPASLRFGSGNPFH